jgi:lipid-binding SYLF domain-containing protein
MSKSRFIGSVFAAAVIAGAMMSMGCSTAPKTPEQRQSLVGEADAAVQSMIAKDPSLRDFIAGAHGYAIFPNVAKAGVGVGGASGRGVVYEDGRPVGYSQLNQGSIGLQLGAESYAELIVFKDQAALDRVKAGNFDVGADVSAVALKAGAGKSTEFESGMAIFVQPKGGLMAEASVKGQKISFEPMDQSEAASLRQPPARPGSSDSQPSTSDSSTINSSTSGISTSGSTTSGSSASGTSGGVDVKVESK